MPKVTIRYQQPFCKAEVFLLSPGEEFDASPVALAEYEGVTRFNHTYIDFLDTFAPWLNSSIPVEKRVQHSTDQLQLVSMPEIQTWFSDIEHIANLPIQEIRQLNLEPVFRDRLGRISKHLFTLANLPLSSQVLVPLGGGALVLESVPNTENQVIAVECKRVPLMREPGAFGFGMSTRIGQSPVIRDPNKSLCILELAIASGITTIGILLDLFARNNLPPEIEILAPVLTQQGAELVQLVAHSLGVRVHFTTARICYHLGDFYKDRSDSVLNENGRYVIGKATEILRPYLNGYLRENGWLYNA